MDNLLYSYTETETNNKKKNNNKERLNSGVPRECFSYFTYSICMLFFFSFRLFLPLVINSVMNFVARVLHLESSSVYTCAHRENNKKKKTKKTASYIERKIK